MDRCVPRMLNDVRKRTCLDISMYHLSRFEDDLSNLIQRVLTQVHHFDRGQKCRANNRSSLVYPLLRNLIGFSQHGRWWPQSFGIHDVEGWSWLSWSRSHIKRCTLCRQIEAATSVNRKKEERKTDSQCSALAGQRPCQHVTVTSCHDCRDWMWIWNPASSFIFSLYGSFWLTCISIPKTEIPSS